jgi:hypothetical protein
MLRAGGLVLAAGLSTLGVLAAFGGSWRWPFAVADGLALATAGAFGVVAIRRATRTRAGSVARGLGYALAVLGFAAAAGAAIVALTAAVGLVVTLLVGLAVLAIVIVAIHLAGGF